MEYNKSRSYNNKIGLIGLVYVCMFLQAGGMAETDTFQREDQVLAKSSRSGVEKIQVREDKEKKYQLSQKKDSVMSSEVPAQEHSMTKSALADQSFKRLLSKNNFAAQLVGSSDVEASDFSMQDHEGEELEKEHEEHHEEKDNTQEDTTIHVQSFEAWLPSGSYQLFVDCLKSGSPDMENFEMYAHAVKKMPVYDHFLWLRTQALQGYMSQSQAETLISYMATLVSQQVDTFMRFADYVKYDIALPEDVRIGLDFLLVMLKERQLIERKAVIVQGLQKSLELTHVPQFALQMYQSSLAKLIKHVHKALEASSHKVQLQHALVRVLGHALHTLLVCEVVCDAAYVNSEVNQKNHRYVQSVISKTISLLQELAAFL